MKTHNELMMALSAELDKLCPLAAVGDEDAHIEWAIGKAIYDTMAEGHRLTDLDWFKYTSYYTGTQRVDWQKAPPFRGDFCQAA